MANFYFKQRAHSFSYLKINISIIFRCGEQPLESLRIVLGRNLS
jgi:hypothetical protein